MLEIAAYDAQLPDAPPPRPPLRRLLLGRDAVETLSHGGSFVWAVAIPNDQLLAQLSTETLPWLKFGTYTVHGEGDSKGLHVSYVPPLAPGERVAILTGSGRLARCTCTSVRLVRISAPKVLTREAFAKLKHPDAWTADDLLKAWQEKHAWKCSPDEVKPKTTPPRGCSAHWWWEITVTGDAR
ncbi:MAG: hypothetical protein WC700_09110 [Gemmatimonadaceae bacterium]|jgi:hypothetical protein